MNIANKTVLITGANRGIGRALVSEALRRGAERVYAGVRGGPEIADPRVTPLTFDVTNATQIARATEQVGSLDVLVNNAGIALYDDLSNPALIEQHLAVNLYGPLNVTRAFLPLLRRSQGAVVNNLSVVALAPVPVIPGYSISKAAALNMTQALRALLAGKSVSVHAVFLGPIDTDMNRGFDIPKAPTEVAARASSMGLSGARRISSPIRCRSPLRKLGGRAPPRRWSVSSRPSCHRAQRRLDGFDGFPPPHRFLPVSLTSKLKEGRRCRRKATRSLIRWISPRKRSSTPLTTFVGGGQEKLTVPQTNSVPSLRTDTRTCTAAPRRSPGWCRARKSSGTSWTATSIS